MTQGGAELSTSRMVALRANSAGATKKPLFMFAGVRGGPDTFRDLAAQLGDDRPVYGVHYIGAQHEPELVRNVARMAQLYAAEVRGVQRHGPYYLFGYSLGGMIVFELARELMAQGERVGLVIMADCAAPGYPQPAPLVNRIAIHVDNLRSRQAGHRLEYLAQRFKNVRTRIAKLTGFIPYVDPKEVIPPHMKKLDAALWEAYRNYKPMPLNADVLFLTADTPPEWPTVSFDDPLRGWGDILRGRISQCSIPGTHLSVFAPQNLPVLAARIRNGLARAERLDADANAHAAPVQIKQL
jgi:thioesterase domain-containing protein